MKRAYPTPSNPGPRWGFRTIAYLELCLPPYLFKGLLNLGTFVGLLLMSDRRRYSAEYWRAIAGRSPTLREQFRQFRAFMTGLVLKLKSGRGGFPDFQFAPHAHKSAFIDLCSSPQQILFGTFHVGYSDLMGCMLKSFNRKVSMVRLRMENSLDTDILESIFGEYVRFLWINQPGAFIFELKDAIERGESIGLQCDRTEFGSKLESYHFLDTYREFPVTIYHLADLFKLPVVFAFTGPLRNANTIEVYTSPVFFPGNHREENLKKGAQHFQNVLNELESHLRRHPELWFNFCPLNKATRKPGSQ